MRSILRAEIKKALNKKINFNVFTNEKFGDYSSNVAMILAKDLKNNPIEVANNLKSQISNLKSGFFEKIEVAPPGFLNFTLSEKGLIEGVTNICDSKYLSRLGKGKRIQLEFISANPTGELHIGHGRSAFYGDSLANVLEKAGHKVEREYLINDSKESTQIKELGKTVLGKGKSYLTDYLKSKIQDTRYKIQKTQDEGEVGYRIAKKIQKDNEKFIKSLALNLTIGFQKNCNCAEKMNLRKRSNY